MVEQLFRLLDRDEDDYVEFSDILVFLYSIKPETHRGGGRHQTSPCTLRRSRQVRNESIITGMDILRT